jgi:hypothetical protein
MPFHPGILVSAFLLIFCLGINLTQYPTVRGMLCDSMNQPAPVQLIETKNAPIIPAAPNTKDDSIVTKTSKVNKPIQLDSKPEPLTEPPTEPLKKEPMKTKEPKAEPSKPEPSKPEPPKSEPSKPKPPELLKTESPKPEPLKTEPLKQERPKTEPLKQELPKTEPLKSEQPKTESLKSEPLKTEPLKPEPSKTELPKTDKVESSKMKMDSKENFESAFSPIVPSSIEKEYQQSKNQRINQLALFTPEKSAPTLSDVMKPSQPMPMYGNEYKPPQPSQNQKTSPNTIPSTPAKNNSKPPSPTAIWNSIDSALERPLMYETP